MEKKVPNFMRVKDFFEKEVADGTMRPLETDYDKTGIYGRWECDPELLEEIALFMWHGTEYFLEMVTAIDRIDEQTIVGVYSFNRFDHVHRVVFHVPVPRDNPKLPSIGMIFSGAVWHERETAEFFGITYSDSVDSRNLLLEEDSTDHPLRKDFEAKP